MKLEPQKLVLGIRELPAIPGMIAETLRIVDDPSASSVEIESVVGRDQSLTARVLRVANSAAFGFPRQIESVREAIVILGTRKLKHVVAVMVATDLFKGDNTELMDPRQLWSHALAASLWARHIVEWRQLWGCGSAVTAALLHDLGILILLQKARDSYQPVLTTARDSGLPLHEVESRELGVTHAFIGGALCAKWQLPVSITQLVSHHHSVTPPSDPALGVVMLANVLAHRIDAGPFSWKSKLNSPMALMGIDMDSGPGLEFFQSKKQIVLDQVLAFHHASDV
ncbi:MAG: HDOD domain-containing protein [bacterium]